MSKAKSGKQKLGKGMAALLSANTVEVAPDPAEGSTSVSESTGQATGQLEIEISKIKTNEYQPRKIFKDTKIKELAQSISENGLMQPIIVQKSDSGYELIAGERRLRAMKSLGKKSIPAIIRSATGREKLVLALIENIQRDDLNCIEEALAYFQLINEFKLTQEELAKKVGKDRSTVANFLRLLKLPRVTIDLLQKQLLSMGHAKVLGGLKDDELIERLSKRCVDEDWSVRSLEVEAKKAQKPQRDLKADSIDQDKTDLLKSKLERKTGFHFHINEKDAGKGEIRIRYSNEAEFNDIFEYLMR